MTTRPTTRRKTKATRGKLERALEQLESFGNADNVEAVLSYDDRYALAKATSIIRRIESELWRGN